MLITLNIKFKAKLRKDGLYEITPLLLAEREFLFMDILPKNLPLSTEKKIRQAKKVTSTKAKKSKEKKKKSDCMTLFAWFDE